MRRSGSDPIYADECAVHLNSERIAPIEKG